MASVFSDGKITVLEIFQPALFYVMDSLTISNPLK